MTRAALSSALGARKLDSATLAAQLDAAQADASLRTLSLRHAGLTPNLAVQLADFLEVNRSLTELDLTGNVIGSHGASCIAASLRKNDVLQRLTLARCGLKSDAVKPWAEYFQPSWASGDDTTSHQTLRYIDLSDNQIDDDAAEDLGILIASVACPSKDGESVALDLRRNWLADDAMRSIATAIQKNHAILTLRLEGNQDDEAVLAKKQIAFCLQRNLHELTRRKTLQLITKISQSTVIDLHECKFEYVELSLCDAQLLSDALRSNRSLTSLVLRDNALPEEATRRLLSALDSHPCIRTLRIQDNDIREIGFVAVNRLLRHSGTLRELSLINSVHATASPSPVHSFLSRETLAALHHTLAMDTVPLRSLALVNCGLDDVEIGVIVSGAGWACCLEALELRNNAMTDHSVGVLARMMQRCSELHTMDVSANQLSLNGALAIVKAVGSHPSLRSLRLGRFAQYDAPLVRAIMSELRASQTLVRVDISTKLHASRCVELVEDLHAEWVSRRKGVEDSRRRRNAQDRQLDQQQAQYRTIVRRTAVQLVKSWLPDTTP